jgi:hypothetical protein
MPVAKALYMDPFAPVLFNSPPLNITIEQQEYIKDILRKACSDSRFVEKSYRAIMAVLTLGNTEPPIITSLSPNSATIGEPAFDIHVHGSGFDQNSRILFNQIEEPTTMVSPNELTTGINMPLWTAPATVPVSVMNSNGLASQAQNFTFNNPAARSSTEQNRQTTVVKTPDNTFVKTEKK